MAHIEVLLPAMGEGVTDATITKFLVRKGDFVEEEQPIIEIATDKVDSEVSATVSGRLIKFIAEEGEIVAVGSVIAIIETDEEENVHVESERQVEFIDIQDQKEEKEFETSNSLVEDSQSMNSRTADGRFISPLVRSIAGAEGISVNQLEKIEGTGKEGRITKDDILKYLRIGAPDNKKPQEEIARPIEKKEIEKTKEKEVAFRKPLIISDSNNEIVEMDRMRRLISDHMVFSKQTSPHVTLFAEADVTSIVNWRNKNKDVFQKSEGQKLTFTPIFFEAIVNSLKENMDINVSVDGYSIIKKKTINLGMATMLPDGNLIVPVIKAACEKSLRGLISLVNDLAERARTNKLKPDEIKGGTFTVTNLGTFGAISGTPIINQPEVAILSLGAIKKRPVVMETELGDVIAVRHIIMLSLTHDHRVVDGAMAGKFLYDLVQKLEKFSPERII